MKHFYTDYTAHCINFYIRRMPEKPKKFNSKADELNWLACDKVFHEFGRKQQSIIYDIFINYKGPIERRVKAMAKGDEEERRRIWGIITAFNYKVAQYRGLI